MWESSELKTSAKDVLKSNYWKSFLISLIVLIAGGEHANGGFAGGRRFGDTISEWTNYSNFIVIFTSSVILLIAFRILIGYALEVGSRKYFIQSAQHKNDMGCYNFAFDSKNFKGIVSTMLLKGVYSFLWSLLLIIPGIIKSYAYRMVPYILADNPELGADEAITLSTKMMDGNKLSLFILELSFIGWYLLGTLALGIGVLFVNPYYNATEAQLYLVLRDKAIGLGYCTHRDLNIQNDNFFDHDGYYRG